MACRGTLSQQAPGNGLQIKPQVNDPSTAQNPVRELHKRKQKTKDRRPTNADAKTRPAGLLPRNLPNLPHLRELWLKTQKQNVCLFASFVLDMTANTFHCKMKCKTSQTECSHNHKPKQKQSCRFQCFHGSFQNTPGQSCIISRRLRPIHFVHGSVLMYALTLPEVLVHDHHKRTRVGGEPQTLTNRFSRSCSKTSCTQVDLHIKISVRPF